jgi:enterochelin esterase family protein
MQHLTQLNKIRPAVYAFVHSVSGEQRQQDYGCRDLFSQSLLYELTEQLIQKYPSISHQNITLCGQSLGGLCALYSAMLYPAIFQNLILQSGSYWWSDFSKSTLAKDHVGNLLEFIKHRPNTLSQKTQIYISAGFYETDMQEDSFQLYQQLQAFNQVSFHRFVGGHDPVNWRSDLIKALQVFLSL